ADANPQDADADDNGYKVRSLASRSQGLALAIAARQALASLNRQTQEINPHGSPYFNTLTELHLGPLTQRELAGLLELAGDAFDQEDRRFVADLSGGHPYLAQAAGSALWEADQRRLTGDRRYQSAADDFFRETAKHFADTWEVMGNEARRAVTAVALIQLPALLEERGALTRNLDDHLADYTPELEWLADSGMVSGENGKKWLIRQQGFLWWLADELRHYVRDEAEFGEWLQRHTLDGVLTMGEREWMGRTAVKVTQFLGAGAGTLVEEFIKRMMR
ncbi:MAG: hypothetical protein ACE5EY_17755, partial [Anaerolineae bacterium]